MKWKVLVAVLLLPAQVAAQVAPEKVASEVKVSTEAEAPVKVSPEDIEINPPIPVMPAGEDRIVPLGEGVAAPFSGQLFDTNTALRWGMWLQQLQNRYKMDMAMQMNICNTDIAHNKTLLMIEKTRALTVRSDLMTRLTDAETKRLAVEDKVRNPGFFESNGFYFALGILTTGTVVGLSAWAISSSK